MNTDNGGQPAKPDETARVTELEQALATLQERHAEQERQLAFYRTLATERENSIGALRGSKSWKVTAPLRGAGTLMEWLLASPRAWKALLRQFGSTKGVIVAVIDAVRRDGLRGLWFRSSLVLDNAARAKGDFDATAGTPDPWGAADGADLETRPLISVLIPVYNTPREMLDATIWSVRRQTYPKWELCVVDDASKAAHVREVLDAHARQDNRIKVRYRAENGNISATTNDALAMAVGDYMTVLDHDDLLDPKALYGVARTISEHPESDYIYTDEDKVSADGARFYGPFYKPDWSPEYLLSLMYTCHMSAFRMSLVREVGGYRSAFDTAQDLDFTLRFLLRAENIRHIPRVLYHWRVWEQSTAQSHEAKPEAEARARKALEEYLVARGENFAIGPGPRPGHHEVRFLPRGEPLVSIVIPTANGKIEIDGRTEWHIDAVTDSIFEKTTWPNYEIVVMHNGNLREEQLASLSARPNVRLLLYQAEKFNLAEKINLGVAASKGEYLVLLNDDIRVITPDWITLMLGMAQREGVGAVGPKLLFPDGTIQHAGVVILGGCPGHAYYQWPRDSEGYSMGACVARNYIAVTGACLMTSRRLYDEVKGFDERYPNNYNDVDFCLKLHERGFRSVYLPAAVLYHYEGVSKEGGRSVGVNELEMFLADWGQKMRHDPYYNPNLSQHAPYQF